MPPGSGFFLQVNEFARDTPWLHGPAAAYAQYGLILLALLCLAGWWVARGRDPQTMAAALLVPVGALVAFAVQQVVVALVQEPRPYASLSGVLVLVPRTTDPSFPSDHACLAGAVAAGLFLVDRRLAWAAVGLAVLMAAVRVYVGAHWPLDVVAGLALGAGVAVLVVLLARRPVARLVEWAEGTWLRPALTSGPAPAAS